MVRAEFQGPFSNTGNGLRARHYRRSRLHDSDPLDERLRTERGIEMIARHRSNRKRPKTQDGRALRRVLRRWKIERLFAWLQNYRPLVTRWEYHAENFLGFVRLGCICILLRQF